MTGLLKKDLLLLKKSLRSYALFLVFYLGLSLAGVFPLSAATAVLEMVVLVLPLSAFAYDEQAHWGRYVMALPLSPAQVVGGRYLLMLVLLAAVMALNGLFCLVAGAFRLSAAEVAASALVTTGLVLLVQSVCLPLCYKLGVERARPFFYAAIFLPFLLGVAAEKLGWLDLSRLNRLSDGAALALCALPLCAGLTALGASYLVSCRVVAEMEY